MARCAECAGRVRASAAPPLPARSRRTRWRPTSSNAYLHYRELPRLANPVASTATALAVASSPFQLARPAAVRQHAHLPLPHSLFDTPIHPPHSLVVAPPLAPT